MHMTRLLHLHKVAIDESVKAVQLLPEQGVVMT